ncbi:PQQ-binding-like beta-propeller repeat protein [Luteolibacter flavescens]|uniref:PQQ-binding-like beta-propeller repeat protein n=1 Tax=Luteolibacter flavescens TaxID=1859460 RepID=A0ABT3FKU6_9BACT|nr:PQQ-binding-like beta-propeller repeat protein [Luteolibacter flavescens]MCW1884190.1 PQQ-binding-like beta-propeller repeat protein [Luteolibacter flavescens]
MPSVLVLATEWESSHGGISSFNRTLCRYIAGAGWIVYCFLPRKASDRENKSASEADVNLLHPGDSFVDSPLDDKSLLSLPPTISSDVKIDWIFGHGHVTGPAALIQKFSNFKNSRLAHFVHVAPGATEWFKSTSEGTRAAAKAEIRERLEVTLASRADLVVAVGPLLKREISNLLHEKEDRIYQLDPGLNITSTAIRRPPPGEQCLLIGRAEDAILKGLDIAARAFAEAVKERTPRPVLVVRGALPHASDQLRNELIKWAGIPGLDIRVREYSPDDKRVNDDLQRAVLALMPSRAEGFGLVALEALGAGVPFLASKTSGFAELVRNRFGDKFDRFLVPVVDDEISDKLTWASAIKWILDNPILALDSVSFFKKEYSRSIKWEDSIQGLLERMNFDHKTIDTPSKLDQISSDLTQPKYQSPTQSIKHSSLKDFLAQQEARRNQAVHQSQCLLVWEADVGIGSWKNKPIVSGEKLVIPSSGRFHNLEDPFDGVFCLSKATGETIWRSPTEGDANAVSISDSKVIVGTDRGRIHCFDLETGIEEWTNTFRSAIITKPLFFSDRVLVCTMDGELAIIAISSGHHIKSEIIHAPVASNPLKIDGKILIFTTFGLCYEFSEIALFSDSKSRHKELHRFYFEDEYSELGLSECEFWGDPVILGDTIIAPYVRQTTYSGLPVIGIDKNNILEKWNSPKLPSEMERQYGNIRATPCIANQCAYLPISYGNEVACINESGDVKWIAESGTPFFPQYGSPDYTKGLILVPRFDGYVHAIDAETGVYLWKILPGEEQSETLSIKEQYVHHSAKWENQDAAPLNSHLTTDEDMFYIHSSNGKIYAYRINL